MVPVAVLLCFDCTGGKGETVLHVQDFSDAHRRGLQVGFAKVKREYTRISWADATEDELVREGEGILSHVKGCVFHYKQSVLRLSKKRMMIPHAQAERFKELAHRLLTRSASKFERTIRELRREFPLVTTAGRRKRGWTGPGWLEWWTAPDGKHGAMIFPSKKRSGDQNQNGPETNNVSESGNRDDARVDGKKNKAAVLALHSSFHVAKTNEKRYGLIHKGYKPAYGGCGRMRGAQGRGMDWAGSTKGDPEWCGDYGRPHAAESPTDAAKRPSPVAVQPMQPTSCSAFAGHVFHPRQGGRRLQVLCGAGR